MHARETHSLSRGMPDYLREMRRLAGDVSRIPPRPLVGRPVDCRAAVFVLLVERQDPSLLMIKRADRGDPWSGQIAFPGGREEAGDDNLRHTAFRELFEEMGIAAEDIVELASAGFFRTHLLPVDLQAFIGLWRVRSPLAVDPREVASTHELSLCELWIEHIDSGYAGHSAIELGDTLVYHMGAERIWGVTARIIHYLLEHLINLTGETS